MGVGVSVGVGVGVIVGVGEGVSVGVSIPVITMSGIVKLWLSTTFPSSSLTNPLGRYVVVNPSVDRRTKLVQVYVPATSNVSPSIH